MVVEELPALKDGLWLYDKELKGITP